MPLLVEKRSLDKIKGKIKANQTSHISPAKTTIRKAIMPPIILNLFRQKNSCSFSNFHVDDC